jgi:hypothetical protein
VAVVQVASLDNQQIAVALVINDGTGNVEGIRVRNATDYGVRVTVADGTNGPEQRDTGERTDTPREQIYGRSLRPRTALGFSVTVQPVPRVG